uniref:Uncharacterized protein n=1 Tax=Anopheles atroparvus TaxID=41427 RepID=A0A182JI00_ANOAO
MLRPRVPAVYLLAMFFVSGSYVWCFEEPYVARHRLDALFRAQPSAQKHSGPMQGVGSDGSGVAPSSVSHGSLAAEHHPPLQQEQQKPPFQALAPMAQHRGVLLRRAAEPGGIGSRPRWHADQRPKVFGSDTVPAFRALPALEFGHPDSEEDYVDHQPGGPRPLDTFDLPVALDPAENEIGDSPLSMAALGRPRVEEPAEEFRQNGGGRMTESIDLIREQLERIKQEEDIEIKSNLLMKLLTELPEGPLPIVYIEDAPAAGNAATTGDADGDDDEGAEDEDEGRIVTEQFTPNGGKRSGRYYRRYPWKRQNSRSRTYDAEARYLCVPSRDDVFKLLVGLHENRVGNHQRTVNFCNRKRPAKAIFTNIRFLG